MSESKQSKIIDFFQMVRPWKMSNHQKVRIGRDEDGGYVIPKMPYNFDLCISVGIEYEVSFDRDLADQNTKILMFDHTINKLPYEHPNFYFYKLGLGPVTQNNFISLSDIKKNPLVLESKHKILKFDIEGAEFDIFKTLDVADLEDFEVITFEMHSFEKLIDDVYYDAAFTMIEKLNKNHIPIWVHANNFGQMFFIEGLCIPQVLEMTFMRRDLDEFPEFSRDPIPGPYDMPNRHGPDIVLNLF